MTTDLYFLLDASGSMQGSEGEVINHFNEYLDHHKVAPEETFLSLAIFNSERFDWVYQWSPVADVPPLTAEDYQTVGMTPLNDSVAKVLDVAAKNADTGKLVIIITDGAENTSTDYPGVGNPTLKARIDALDTLQWGVVYLGVSMSAKMAAVGAKGLSVPIGNSTSADDAAEGFAVAAAATDNYYSNRRGGRQQMNLTATPRRKKK